MRYLDLTLENAAANIALDEALLETAEASDQPLEILRVWEPIAPLVVVGRSSSILGEVRLKACQDRGVPVIRRSSGGLSVVAGPGCLMYALVLSYDLRPELRQLDVAHRRISAALIAGLSSYVPDIDVRGSSDLVIGSRKVSGNSVRCKRRCMLYHGTLLYDFPLALIGELLHEPHRAPDYRAGRSHADFVANLPTTREQLCDALTTAWHAREPLAEWPQVMTASLVAEKYSHAEWNFRH